MSLNEILSDRSKMLSEVGSLVAEFIKSGAPEGINIEDGIKTSSYKISLVSQEKDASTTEIEIPAPAIEIDINGRGLVTIKSSNNDEILFSQAVPFQTTPHSLNDRGSKQIIGDICYLLADEANTEFIPFGIDLQKNLQKRNDAGHKDTQAAAARVPGNGRGNPLPV